MRVNVYAEEITGRVEVVEKVAPTGARFLGLRFYLASAPELHDDPDDDDSSAVTFWVRSSSNGYEAGDELKLLRLLEAAHLKLRSADAARSARSAGSRGGSRGARGAGR